MSRESARGACLQIAALAPAPLSARPPGRDEGARIFCHGRRGWTRLLAEGKGGWLLVGTGFRRGVGAYTVHHPPEQVLGGWGGAGTVWLGGGLRSLVGCSKVKVTVSVEADAVQN